MRKRQTFLLTILSPESEAAPFCGRIKVIASGKTSTFTNLEELYHVIASEMDEDTLSRASVREFSGCLHEDPGLSS
jgi:hypothetical protein